MPRFTAYYEVPTALPGIPTTNHQIVFDVQGHDMVDDTVRNCAKQSIPEHATLTEVKRGDTRL